MKLEQMYVFLFYQILCVEVCLKLMIFLISLTKRPKLVFSPPNEIRISTDTSPCQIIYNVGVLRSEHLMCCHLFIYILIYLGLMN